MITRFEEKQIEAHAVKVMEEAERAMLIAQRRRARSLQLQKLLTIAAQTLWYGDIPSVHRRILDMAVQDGMDWLCDGRHEHVRQASPYAEIVYDAHPNSDSYAHQAALACWQAVKICDLWLNDEPYMLACAIIEKAGERCKAMISK